MEYRDQAKGAACGLGIAEGSVSLMEIDLGSLDGVRSFAEAFQARGRSLEAIVCTAAVYLPVLKEPSLPALIVAAWRSDCHRQPMPPLLIPVAYAIAQSV